MREEIIATLPQDDAECTLEVAFVHTDTNDGHVELRHLVWGKGLGWYRQKTLRLEASPVAGTGAGAAPSGAQRHRRLGQKDYSVSGCRRRFGRVEAPGGLRRAPSFLFI
jgi:hypothetical protein